MKIVIEISESIYDKINQHNVFPSDVDTICDAIFLGIPLPEHHGRLIDADDLREDFKTSKKISFVERMDISCIVDHAPTIIEGSESE